MLDDALPALACPHCRAPLHRDAATLACETGHRFDVARQGYVSLLEAGAGTGSADTAAMVADRAAVQAAGHLAPVAEALAQRVATDVARPGDGATADPLVVDLGAGTGYYLARVLEQTPSAVGLALDISKHAARRAARAHPRIGSVVADAWGTLPVRDRAAAAVLNVFAPRRPVEVARVLRPGGVLAAVVPQGDHLAELVGPLGMLTVDDDKPAALRDRLAPHLEPGEATALTYRRDLGHDDVRRLVGMGPSAWHARPDALDAALRGLPDPVAVTFSVHLLTFRAPGP